MKRFLRITLYTILAITGLAAAGILFFFLKYPKVDPPSTITIERTPDRIARGKYLVTHVSGCLDCHSTRDWKYFAAPINPGTEGKGGEVFDEHEGVPGKLFARNITPAGIGTMTDGELLRVLTSGVDRNGKVLFPLMPYSNFNEMSDEDLYSMIAYIRTLQPIENDVPKSQVNFPVNFIIRTVPTNHQLRPEPNRNNPYEYGKYLVENAGVCGDCHTPRVNGKPQEGMNYAGGMEFRTPYGTIRSANITPDEETGIGLWTKEDFTARFKSFGMPKSTSIDPDSMNYYTIMPWTSFSGMTEEDLGSIYMHLRTITPVKHKVEHFTALKK
jgi:mono/diheme cytochrome c family protein